MGAFAEAQDDINLILKRVGCSALLKHARLNG